MPIFHVKICFYIPIGSVQRQQKEIDVVPILQRKLREVPWH